jgi:hypothetical protein
MECMVRAQDPEWSSMLPGPDNCNQLVRDTVWATQRARFVGRANHQQEAAAMLVSRARHMQFE